MNPDRSQIAALSAAPASGDALAADALVERVRAAALEEAAERVESYCKPQALRLAAGEMTAQEMRTVTAVGGGIAAAIRALKGYHHD